MKQPRLHLGVPAVLTDRAPTFRPGSLVRGILWMLVAAAGVTVMGALVKSLGQRLSAPQLAGTRSGIMVLVMALFMVRDGPGVFRARRPRLLAVRAGLLTYINGVGFWTLSVLPLFFVTAVSFTKPLFVTLLAALVLGEAIRLRRTLAMAAGFAGVLVTLVPHGTAGPDAAVTLLPALACLTIALAMALSVVVVKRIAEVDQPTTIVFWPNLAVAVLLGGASLPNWVPPTPVEWALIVALAAVGWGAQQSFIRAYRCAEAGVLAPFEYARIPLAALIGILVFAETPTGWTVAGAGIIAASTLYIAQRETQLARQARADQSSATGGARSGGSSDTPAKRGA